MPEFGRARLPPRQTLRFGGSLTSVATFVKDGDLISLEDDPGVLGALFIQNTVAVLNARGDPNALQEFLVAPRHAALRVINLRRAGLARAAV
jgi:hypothetical protein